ncbi:MAG TPA: pilus assembly PilX N-terminal domain-containing protein [Vicinamibacterales bacterium]
MSVSPRLRASAARAREERGIALVLALLGMVLLMTLGGALVVLTATETRIAASFRDALEVFYAAEAGMVRAVVDLRTADWGAVLAGTSKSSVANGAFDLVAAGRDIEVVGGRRGWRPYAYGSLADLVPGAAAGRLSVVVWVAAEAGADDIVIVRSHAYGPGGVRRMVEATVGRTPDGARVLDWREER